MGSPRRVPALLLMSALSWAPAACVALRPLEELRAELPPERYVLVQDEPIYVEQAGAGEPVVLLHGIRASSFAWRHIAPGLSERFRVIAPDVYGHGYSPRPRDEQAYSLAGQGRLVLEVLDRLGCGKVHLVGHSMGAGIALWIAANHPERVRSLVLVAGPPSPSINRTVAFLRWIRPAVYLYLRTIGLSRWGYSMTQKAIVHDNAVVTPEYVDGYRKRLCVDGLWTSLCGITAALRFPDPGPLLGTIEAPVMVVCGENDSSIGPPVAERLAQANPGARLVRIPRCGHNIPEEAPGVLLEAINGFLAGVH